MKQQKPDIFLVVLLVTGLLATACGTSATVDPVVEEVAPTEEAAPVEEEEVVEEPVLEPVTFQVFYPVAVDAPIAAICPLEN